jgi:GTP-binding protein Era
MEAFFGVKVFLDLWVKVKKNWRDSETEINRFGYKLDDRD